MGLFMRPISSQPLCMLSDEGCGAGRYRSFPFIIGIIFLLVIGLTLSMAIDIPWTGSSGQDSKIFENYRNNYQGVLGLYRMSHLRGAQDGIQDGTARGLYGRDAELPSRALDCMDGF